MTDVKVRFAPSPTGDLHVGGARTALFCWVFAKSMGGKFVLRIEDTDIQRSSRKYITSQMEDLKWLGIDWDEKPIQQSERQQIYKKHSEILIKKDKAYYCFCKDLKSKELECEKKCLTFSEEKVKALKNKEFSVRFKNLNNKDYCLDDIIRKKVTFPSNMVGNFVLIRSNGRPVYNFSCVVDDHLMNITHVLRSEEHLSNTLRQLMLYEAFDWELPKFAHLSLILDEDRKKLSKRFGSTSVKHFKNQGFLPEALVNYLTLLGWTHPKEKEIFSRSSLINLFSLEKINASPAIFDLQKLKWVNSNYLRSMDKDTLANNVHLKINKDPKYIKSFLDIFLPYSDTLNDLVSYFDLLNDDMFKVGNDGLKILNWEKSKDVLLKWQESLQKFDQHIDSKGFDEIHDKIKNDCKVKGKEFFMPIRVAVLGIPSGVTLNKIIPLMNIKSLLFRVNHCLEKL